MVSPLAAYFRFDAYVLFVDCHSVTETGTVSVWLYDHTPEDVFTPVAGAFTHLVDNSRLSSQLNGMLEALPALSGDDVADLIGYVTSRPRHVNLRQVVVKPIPNSPLGSDQARLPVDGADQPGAVRRNGATSERTAWVEPQSSSNIAISARC